MKSQEKPSQQTESETQSNKLQSGEETIPPVVWIFAGLMIVVIVLFAFFG